MFQPPVGNIDLEALSGICGSISIACWVVVFSPQIIENFRRGSADGLSLLFLVVWLAGDVFNILGAVLQGVLPTMIILAVYYTLADIVLLGQCFYYRGFTLRDEPSPPSSRLQESDAEDQPSFPGKVSERTALLSAKANDHSYQAHLQEHTGNGHSTSGPSGQQSSPHHQNHRRHSATSFRDILHSNVDGTHLSPVTPFVEPSAKEARPARRVSALQNALFNLSAVILVCAAGVLGWYVSPGSSKGEDRQDDSGSLSFDTLGQVFGYLCAALYLGSRLPQILLNYRRKSTDGVSLLFFLFACIGNLTYVLSILAYSPVCKGEYAQGRVSQCRPGEAAALYGRYILVNLSWLIGSLGTLFLDMVIFAQFFLYQDNNYGEAEGTSEETLRG
ncbi:PQ loop repeat-domain-containing protein [Aspergillus pseudonomiae]|uniref:PQ loop repeat-domain-containing protein n=1 Tax=Aspergillus pseudonomiae TaxID=1506151 RepID=A0A5N7D403_9EURO|nr:PQ loop repeat-domain-containing protein [Aspergillus pseudonomiae]KAE8401124.1 PQ loop repeat-domain-containing protein [Aspergillus pseudonomiae]